MERPSKLKSVEPSEPLNMSETIPTENLAANTEEPQENASSEASASQGQGRDERDRFGFLGGNQTVLDTDLDPADVIRKREIKWLQMLTKWNKVMGQDFKTIRSRCRKGIPRSVRGRAWFYLCGAVYLQRKNPTCFQELLTQEGQTQCIDDIRKDVHRQFPSHEIFSENGHGQEDLFRVLKAYSIFNPSDGYCQAHAPIAATLLLHMPAEDAFWCLVCICDKYLKDYYSPGMNALKLDGNILFGLFKRVSPASYRKMKKLNIEPVLYMTEWFLCAFTRTLPWNCVLRVWDMFLCEGVKVLFRVALVLMKFTLEHENTLKNCTSMYDVLTALKTIPDFITQEKFLVHHIINLDVTDDQMRKEHFIQSVKSTKQKQNENH
jgi:hypothetical protein